MRPTLPRGTYRQLSNSVNVIADLRELRAFFEAERIPFGVIFWSGHDPENSDRSYYNHVIDWVKKAHSAIGKPDQSIFQSWVLRVSQSCVSGVPCGAKNTRCSPADPGYCGLHRVPVNLLENNPQVFSHTRLVSESEHSEICRVRTRHQSKPVLPTGPAHMVGYRIGEHGLSLGASRAKRHANWARMRET
jgi:hypothetical protein